VPSWKLSRVPLPDQEAGAAGTACESPHIACREDLLPSKHTGPLLNPTLEPHFLAGYRRRSRDHEAASEANAFGFGQGHRSSPSPSMQPTAR
ncbi:hypothetical protein BAV0261, partial [Bordetella avium 197N]